MKKQFLFGLMSVMFLLITSCEKEDSVLRGRVTYKGAITGIEYKAANTAVYLMLGDADAVPYATVTTDSEGYYSFPNLWKAHWHVGSAITVNGFNYSGVAGTTAVDGKNVITLDLMLQ